MKKFCNKITKQQWRVTVPNINNTLFKKSISKDESLNNSSGKVSKRSSGSYDFQEAQIEYDRCRSLPNSVYIDTDSSSDSCDEHFEDAKAMMSDRSSNNDLKKAEESDSDHETYADVIQITSKQIESKNLSLNNSQFEYDVPKISFKFFEAKKLEEEPENEVEETNYDCAKNSDVEVKVKEASASPEKFVSQTEIHFQNTVKDIEVVPMIKSGSDPNIVLRRKHEESDGDNSDDDGYYKVPRSLKKSHRLSQSLHDFDMETSQPITMSSNTSIEHISCSQIISSAPENKHEISSGQNSENMDYCKTRSKLPLLLRRPTLLKKPVNKWNNFRTKFHNLMAEHAKQQRVGAFDDKEKITINFEEMYKNSKSKCKRVLNNTGKIFTKGRKVPRRQDSSELDFSSAVSTPTVGKVRPPKFELTANDIEYKFNTSVDSEIKTDCDSIKFSKDEELVKREQEFDFASIKSAFRRSKILPEGQNGFEDLRRYIKQGGDFCKELSTILQERAEAETQYAKNLSKLSSKLSRACREGVGGLNEAWKAVAVELESRAEGHRLMGTALLEETARPLRNLTESQHRARKNSETAVDKSARLLSDWRAAEAKGKKQSHTCARDNEKLQDAAILDTNKYGKLTLSRSTSLIQLAHMHNKNTSDKDNAKLEGKKRKAEDAVKKADVEYYTLCVRAERARLEWESAVLRGVSTFQQLEEERLSNLKSVLTSYLHHSNELGPRLIQATDKLKTPVAEAEPTKDLSAFLNLRQSSQQVSEQLLPDFYCEHITLAMNRERRKQALVKLLHLIRQDIERERKSKNGLENLSKAIKQTPNFGAEDSQQSVTEKLYHMKSMLTYLEGARYKVQSALAELDSRPRSGHPLAPHITITRDKSGLQQSILKMPQWMKEEWLESDRSPISEKSSKSNRSDNSDPHNNDVDDNDWTDRGAADGNSNQPDSDFDEFSSQCSSSAGGNNCATEEIPVQPIAKCKALYAYTPNLTDELPLKPGDVLSVYRQQDDGWWLGECNGSVGIFPATYVEIIPA